MNPVIKKFDSTKEYYFQEGCHIVEVSNSDDDKELSIARARVEAGGTTEWHSLHNTSERYVILQGKGVVEIGSLNKTEVQTGDTVIIPPQVRQRIHNHGATDLIFLAICTPPFQLANYNALEGD